VSDPEGALAYILGSQRNHDPTLVLVNGLLNAYFLPQQVSSPTYEKLPLISSHSCLSFPIMATASNLNNTPPVLATTGTSNPSNLRPPITPTNSETNRILQEIQQGVDDANDSTEEPTAKKGKYIKLSIGHFERLMNTCTGHQAIISRLLESPDLVSFPTSQNSSSRPAYYTNAKFEEIACRAIKPIYDGSEDQLIPFLSHLDIRRQNEGWSSATFITVTNIKYDLTSNFASVNEADIIKLAEECWTSPTVDKDKHTVDHDTYNSRLLSTVLMNSITDDFLSTLLNRIPHQLHNDGTFLLWNISNNIHRNNVAFTEHVREKITTATLSQFDNDITKYIIFIKDNLRMITSPSSPSSIHNGLITYILRQLKESPIYIFQRYIRELHIDFQEAKLGNITVATLLINIEDKIRILKHAGEWTESSNQHPSAMALTASTKLSPQLEDIVAKHVKAQLTQLVDCHKSNNNNTNKSGFVHQEWMFIPPTNLGETKQYNNKTFTWCTKCHQGKGQWVSAHDSTTHIEGFRPSPRRFGNPSSTNRQKQQGILKNNPKKDHLTTMTNNNNNHAHVSFADETSNHLDKTADGYSAQLSLQDSINACFNLPDDD
jgi:hypothetical protein